MKKGNFKLHRAPSHLTFRQAKIKRPFSHFALVNEAAHVLFKTARQEIKSVPSSLRFHHHKQDKRGSHLNKFGQFHSGPKVLFNRAFSIISSPTQHNVSSLTACRTIDRHVVER
jgi:hypothetical protein